MLARPLGATVGLICIFQSWGYAQDEGNTFVQREKRKYDDGVKLLDAFGNFQFQMNTTEAVETIDQMIGQVYGTFELWLGKNAGLNMRRGCLFEDLWQCVQD